jgi:hypothetical protein
MSRLSKSSDKWKLPIQQKNHRELHLPNFGKNELESPDFSLVFETVGTNEFQAKRAQSY